MNITENMLKQIRIVCTLECEIEDHLHELEKAKTGDSVHRAELTIAGNQALRAEALKRLGLLVVNSARCGNAEGLDEKYLFSETYRKKHKE